jgi:hypothetical protein
MVDLDELVSNGNTEFITRSGDRVTLTEVTQWEDFKEYKADGVSGSWLSDGRAYFVLMHRGRIFTKDKDIIGLAIDYSPHIEDNNEDNNEDILS